MPVLVTGAEDGLGAHVIDQLRGSGGEVRAYLDATVAGDDEARALRTRGCKVALGEPDDEGHLEAALAQVHTVAHCWGGPLREPTAQVAAAATLASALLGAGVRRLVWVRELAAGAGNRYLAALDEVGRLFEELPIETVVLATALRHGDGDALTDRLASGWLTGSGADPATPHAPVHIADVAQAVGVADRQRGVAGELHLRLGVVGPDAMPLAQFLRRIRASAQGAGAGAGEPPSWVVDWLSRPAADASASSGLVDTVARGARHLMAPAA